MANERRKERYATDPIYREACKQARRDWEEKQRNPIAPADEEYIRAKQDYARSILNLPLKYS